MILEQPYHRMMAMTGHDNLPFSYHRPYELIDVSGRTCYKSEPVGDPQLLVKKLEKSGHHSVFEHAFFTIKVRTGSSQHDFFFGNDFSSTIVKGHDVFVGTNYRVLNDAALLPLIEFSASEEEIEWLIKQQAYGCLGATVRLITNRGVTHEIVRNRNSFSQESTRYCNYAKDKFGAAITVIPPKELVNRFCNPTPLANILLSIVDKELGVALGHLTNQQLWEAATGLSEAVYLELVNPRRAIPPQIARGVLTNDLKTEIVMTASWERWKWFFFQRTAKAAHPHMRQLAIPLYKDFCELEPSFAGLDIVEDESSYY